MAWSGTGFSCCYLILLPKSVSQDSCCPHSGSVSHPVSISSTPVCQSGVRRWVRGTEQCTALPGASRALSHSSQNRLLSPLAIVFLQSFFFLKRDSEGLAVAQALSTQSPSERLPSATVATPSSSGPRFSPFKQPRAHMLFPHLVIKIRSQW